MAKGKLLRPSKTLTQFLTVADTSHVLDSHRSGIAKISFRDLQGDDDEDDSDKGNAVRLPASDDDEGEGDSGKGEKEGEPLTKQTNLLEANSKGIAPMKAFKATMLTLHRLCSASMRNEL